MHFKLGSIVLLSLVVACAGFAVFAGSSPAEDPAVAASSPVGTDVLPGGESRTLLLAGCTAETTCSNGTVLSCQGSFGETCTENSESCISPEGCSGSRNFVKCGTTKKTCPCVSNDPFCIPEPCEPGAFCDSRFECGDGICDLGSNSCICKQ